MSEVAAQWSNRCDLCDGSRVVGMAFRGKPAPECPWCKSVRMRYGSYFYPITKKNAHLFAPTDSGSKVT